MGTVAEDRTGKAALLVRGSINIDEFFVVPHIVNSGETISSTSYSRRGGGKGANQAVSAAKAGAAVDFAGTVGNDGSWLRSALDSFGVGLGRLLLDDSKPTGRAIIQLSTSTHDNCIVLLQGANHSSYPSPSSPLKYSHLLLQNEIPLSSTLEYLTVGKKEGLQTIFNPSPMLSTEEIKAFPWGGLDWLLVNEGEAKELLSAVGAQSESLAEEDLLKSLGQKLGNTKMNVLVTKGGDGVVALFEGGVVHCGAGKVVGGVKDTTGAGDCFTGYFATFLASHPPTSPSDLLQILEVASQAAAICVESEGAMESVPEVEIVKRRIGASWPARFR